MKYITPGGNAPRLYSELIAEPHLLIAGATGSGKSTLINSLVARLLMTNSPATAQLILIDPKRVELFPLRRLPHCIRYADTIPATIQALTEAERELERRFKAMQKQGRKQSTEPHLYIIIDEYADLITTAAKAVTPIITRLVQLGRAGNIHLIIGTQRPTRDIIAGVIKVNLDCKIALHTATAQDSRNIIGANGAESLPRYGFGIITTPEGLTRSALPPIDPAPLVDYWTSRKCHFHPLRA